MALHSAMVRLANENAAVQPFLLDILRRYDKRAVRQQVIKLAMENPSLRAHLVPLLRKDASYVLARKLLNQMGKFFEAKLGLTTRWEQAMYGPQLVFEGGRIPFSVEWDPAGDVFVVDKTPSNPATGPLLEVQEYDFQKLVRQVRRFVGI